MTRVESGQMSALDFMMWEIQIEFSVSQGSMSCGNRQLNRERRCEYVKETDV